MSKNASTTRKEKLQKIPHIIAAMVTLLHAYERFSHGHKSYLFFLVAGLIFALIVLFHHSLTKRFPWIDTVFFAVEGLLAWIIAYEFMQEGKKALSSMYVLAGLMQFIGIYIFYRKRLAK